MISSYSWKIFKKTFTAYQRVLPFFSFDHERKNSKHCQNQPHFLTFLHWWNISMFQLHNKGLDFKYYFGWQQNIFFSWCSTSTWLWNISICLTLYLFVQKYKFAEDLEKIPFLELNFEFDHWTGKNAINAEQNLPFLLFRKPNVDFFFLRRDGSPTLFNSQARKTKKPTYFQMNSCTSSENIFLNKNQLPLLRNSGSSNPIQILVKVLPEALEPNIGSC